MADRRAFIGGVAGGLLASPLATFAQQKTKLPRIGILGSTYGTAWDAFRLGLRELGYVEGPERHPNSPSYRHVNSPVPAIEP